MRASVLAGITILSLSGAASAPARVHLGASDGGGTRQCISLRAIRDESAEDDDKLLFHAGGSRVYRNQLPAPCDNLRSINDLGKLKLHPAAPDQLCKGDTIELKGSSSTLGVLDIGASDGGKTICTLGDFEPVGEMSISEALRR